MNLCLIIEDQLLQRKTLEGTLRTVGYQVITASTGSDGLALCDAHRPEVVLLDLGLPDIDGLALLPRLIAASPLSRVVVLTGRDSVTEAVEALRSGARHYLVKPWSRDELLLVVEREAAAVNREEALQRHGAEGVFWGTNPAMRCIAETLHKLSVAPLTPVLIEGETGTGKEVVARELHRLTNPPGAFVAVNCAAVPGELLESELFGHERGAFTGADVRRRGLVEIAHRGTLFLDEVGEMSPHLQAKLLRFLQDGTFRRLGAETELSSQCRVVAATHANLDERQRDGRFRSDLFFRLSVVRLKLPPLRCREEDVLPIAYFLLGRIAQRLGRPPRQLSPQGEAAILAHSWPGNVRELANRLERALVLGEGERLERSDLDLVPIGPPYANQQRVLQDAVRLRHVLDEEGWNLSRVARRLGVARHRVKYRVQRLGLRRPDKF